MSRWTHPSLGVFDAFRGRVLSKPVDPAPPPPPPPPRSRPLLAKLQQAVIHAARDVDGLWFPQDDNNEGTDLTFWGPEAGEALRDLRDAIGALDEAEDDLPIRKVTTPDGQVYHADQCALEPDHGGPCMWVGGRRPEDPVYPNPRAPDLLGIVTDPAWAEGHRRADTLDVERLARALHEAGDEGLCWYDADCGTGGKSDCDGPTEHETQAAAILAALQEPTDEP